jgi:hypothetical protein
MITPETEVNSMRLSKMITVSVGVALLTILALPAEAVFPRLLMVYGGPIATPLIVENPKDVQKIFEGISEGVNRNGLDRRPYFELALFWGNDEWDRYVHEGRLSQLKPEDATSELVPMRGIPIRGRFYPACAEAPAQITLTEVNSQAIQSIWRVSPEGLQVLEKLGVPVKQDCK